MNADLTGQLAQLLHARTTAALGTLHDGAPYVSMVPYAIATDGSGFVVHVSRLAAHTKDMLTDTHVSLMVAEAEGAGKPAQALARVSVQATARRIPANSPDLSRLKAAYLARFPEAAQLFALSDFSIFQIRPVSARFVAGFGEAHSLSGESMAALMRQR